MQVSAVRRNPCFWWWVSLLGSCSLFCRFFAVPKNFLFIVITNSNLLALKHGHNQFFPFLLPFLFHPQSNCTAVATTVWSPYSASAASAACCQRILSFSVGFFLVLLLLFSLSLSLSLLYCPRNEASFPVSSLPFSQLPSFAVYGCSDGGSGGGDDDHEAKKLSVWTTGLERCQFFSASFFLSFFSLFLVSLFFV